MQIESDHNVAIKLTRMVKFVTNGVFYTTETNGERLEILLRHNM